MNIFLFYIGTPTPILETKLELIRKHEQLGDFVRVLQCTGNLPNCGKNRNHKNSQCAMCRSKFKNGWQLLSPGEKVELKEIPFENVEISELPLVFNSVDDIKKYQTDGENIGYGIASTLISVLRDHRFNTKKYHNDVILELSTSLKVYKALKREFEEFKPDRVYIFNGRVGTHLPAMLLCKKLGIEYVTIEVANKKNSYRLTKNSTPHEPVPIEDVDLLRSNWTSAQAHLADLFYKKKRDGEDFENILHYIRGQKKGTLPKSFNVNKKNIAIFNGTIDEYAAIEGWNPMYEPDETAGIGKILESFYADDYMFYLRVHPHLKEVASSTSQLLDIRALAHKFKNLHVIWPEEDVDTYALIDACEKIITFGSTVGAEATYWGKPSILAGYATYKKFDCVYTPNSHEELIKLVRSELKPLPVECALQYAFWEISNGIPYKYFKQNGFRNGLAYGTFDGVVIRSNAVPIIWNRIDIMFERFKRIINNPSLILRKLMYLGKRKI